MGVLTRPKIQVQQRFDLEDLESLQGAFRTDSKLLMTSLISDTNTIIKGFQASGLGSINLTINIENSSFVIPVNDSDFSFFSTAPGLTTLQIPGSAIQDNALNYIELSLTEVDNTSLTKAFWDPDAIRPDGDKGIEFNQLVPTMTDLELSYNVSAVGFSANAIPVAVIRTDGSGIIRHIYDARKLLGRLSLPLDDSNEFAWNSKSQVATVVELTGITGTFEVGETVTLGTETATITVVGGSSISVINISGYVGSIGAAATGGTSGATGTIASISEAFSGGDKDIENISDSLKAIMTEIKLMKGTNQWFEDADSNINELATNILRDNQDRNLKLIEGGVWSLNDDGDELTLSDDAYIQIPGIDKERNTIAAQTISLPTVDSVAVISLSRTTGVPIVKTVVVGDYDTLLDDNDLLVIARKVSDGVLVGTGTDLVQPGENLQLDGANSEINRRIGDLNVQSHPSNLNRVRVTPTNVDQLNQSIISKTVGGKQVIFSGRVIDFDSGDIDAFDEGSTIDTFTPFTIPASEYFWYGIGLELGSTNADNSVNLDILITDAASANAVQASAVKPETIGAFKIALVQVFNNGGNIEVVDVIFTPGTDPAGDVPDGSITTPKLAPLAVTNDKLALDSVNAENLILENSLPNNLYIPYIKQSLKYVSAPTVITPGFTANRVRFVKDRFIAVGNSGNAAHSIDGVTWTAMTTGVATALNDVGFSELFQTYYICGNTGTLRYSDDLVTWTGISAGAINYYKFINRKDGSLVVVPFGAGTGNSTGFINSKASVTITAMTGTVLTGYHFYDDETGIGFLFDSSGSATNFRYSTDYIAWTTGSFSSSSTSGYVGSRVINGRLLVPDNSSGTTYRYITFLVSGATRNNITSDYNGGPGNNIPRGIGLVDDKYIIANSSSISAQSVRVFRNGVWEDIAPPGISNIYALSVVQDLIILSGANGAFANTTYVSDDLGVTWVDFPGQFQSLSDAIVHNNDGLIMNQNATRLLTCDIEIKLIKKALTKNRFGA